jgi:uncharacterized membrane protein YeaQ/YmgE (transglycosylase-associated protein family)
MINILGAIISGLIVGALARFFYPGAVPMGWGATMLLGLCGSLLSGFIISRGRTSFHRAGCFASILGAMLLILLVRILNG